MPRKGKRRTVALCIYKDRSGFEAVARLGSWEKWHRFPPSTPISEIKTWQEDTRARYRHSGVKVTVRGTLAADVDVYLAQMTHLAGWVSLRAELRAWVKLYGDRRRHGLTDADALQARQTWLAAKVKPKTVKNREAALSRLWHRLDGRRAIAPTDDLPALHVHKTPIVNITPAVVLTVYTELVAWEQIGRLRNAKTRARFMVYASTGKRPSEIARAEKDDVDLERRVWIVRDGKGGFSPGVYLNDDMLAAWRVFVAASAWGTFREGTFVRTLRRAGWPAGVRPYHLRHTVGMEMSEAGIDLADVQQHMGHTRIDTTRRHYVPVRGSRLQAASEAIDRRFGW